MVAPPLMSTAQGRRRKGFYHNAQKSLMTLRPLGNTFFTSRIKLNGNHLLYLRSSRDFSGFKSVVKFKSTMHSSKYTMDSSISPLYSMNVLCWLQQFVRIVNCDDDDDDDDDGDGDVDDDDGDLDHLLQDFIASYRLIKCVFNEQNVKLYTKTWLNRWAITSLIHHTTREFHWFITQNVSSSDSSHIAWVSLIHDTYNTWISFENLTKLSGHLNNSITQVRVVRYFWNVYIMRLRFALRRFGLCALYK